MSRRKNYNVIILGQGGIGKSELVKCFVGRDRFQSMYDPTIQDQHHVTTEIEHERHVLHVFDVGGFGQFHDNLDPKINECDGFLIAFAINDKESFSQTEEIYEMVTRVKGSQRVPIVLVGTKNDLEANREVSLEEARERATKWRCATIETSAANSRNVPETFHKLVQEIKSIQEGDDHTKPSFLCCIGAARSQAH